MKIKQGDKVQIMTGKNKGHQGVIERVFPKEGKVIISGTTMHKKFARKEKGAPGELIEVPAPIDASNVQVVDPKDSKPTRVGYRKVDGKKVRIFKHSGNEIT